MLRCESYVITENDGTGENALKCNAIALACAECGDSAGCVEHALMCPRCRRAVCDSCADEHRCVAQATGKAKTARAA
jgi:hypothetical protein